MVEPRRSLNADAISLPGARFLIVEARFYDDIGAMLYAGATAALERTGVPFDSLQVPGALEIPIAIAMAVEEARMNNAPYDGAVALGCVIRGETFHFEIVAEQSARALLDLGVKLGLAIGNGILTVENEDQAMQRADPLRGDKGGEAARAALALAQLKHALLRQR